MKERKRRSTKKPFSNFLYSIPRDQTIGSLIEHAQQYTAPSPGIGSLTWDQIFWVQYCMMINDGIRAKMAKLWMASERLETPFEELMYHALDLTLETEIAASLEFRSETASSL